MSDDKFFEHLMRMELTPEGSISDEERRRRERIADMPEPIAKLVAGAFFGGAHNWEGVRAKFREFVFSAEYTESMAERRQSERERQSERAAKPCGSCGQPHDRGLPEKPPSSKIGDYWIAERLHPAVIAAWDRGLRTGDSKETTMEALVRYHPEITALGHDQSAKLYDEAQAGGLLTIRDRLGVEPPFVAYVEADEHSNWLGLREGPAPVSFGGQEWSAVRRRYKEAPMLPGVRAAEPTFAGPMPGGGMTDADFDRLLRMDLPVDGARGGTMLPFEGGEIGDDGKLDEPKGGGA